MHPTLTGIASVPGPMKSSACRFGYLIRTETEQAPNCGSHTTPAYYMSTGSTRAMGPTSFDADPCSVPSRVQVSWSSTPRHCLSLLTPRQDLSACQTRLLMPHHRTHGQDGSCIPLLPPPGPALADPALTDSTLTACQLPLSTLHPSLNGEPRPVSRSNSPKGRSPARKEASEPGWTLRQ